MMYREKEILLLLDDITQCLQQQQRWQAHAPDPLLFDSEQPFFLDTMAPEQWLQWVLIPRLQALIEGEHVLPEQFLIMPYFEEAWKYEQWDYSPLLALLSQLDEKMGQR